MSALSDAILATLDDALLAVDAAGRIVEWNATAARLTGRARDGVIGRAAADVAADVPVLAAALARDAGAAADLPLAADWGAGAAPGAPAHVDLLVRPLAGGGGRVLLFRDAAPRLAVEGAARASQARYVALFEQAPVGVVLHGRDGRILEANSTFQRLVGRPLEALRAVRAAELSPPEDGGVTRGPMQALAAGQVDRVEVEKRLLHADGHVVWAGLTICRIEMPGEAPSFMGIVQDVTARRELEARLVHQASHDPLTGLANRVRLQERMEGILADAERVPNVALLYVDLDDFKKVNDSLGHAAGDALLRIAAERLLNATRGCDVVARLGGDEFAILLPNVRGDGDATIVAERVLRAMGTPFRIGAHEVTVGASVGIVRAATALAPELAAGPPGETPAAAAARATTAAAALLRDADLAMYAAKRGGKGAHARFDPALQTAARERLTLETELRHALDDAQLRLEYQPVVDVATGALVGAEALLRWAHPRLGWLAPDRFIPLAEQTGLIVPIGRWVLREACARAATWLDAIPPGTPFTLAVNVSARQVQDPALVAHVREALATTGFPPSALVLELTESAFLGGDAVLAALHALKALGVRLAIDDFGTGYSSLAYLQQFPVDVLKIDRAFVQQLLASVDGMPPDPARAGAAATNGDGALARAVVSLGRSLSLGTVAEGVESEAQRVALAALGCELAQGWLFDRPLSAADFAARLGLPAGTTGVATEAVGAGPRAAFATA